MKYTSEIIVDLSLTEFIKKFDNTENMRRWQRGLISVEHISGDPGLVGAKMKLNYKIDTRKMSVVETITHRNLPSELHGTYSAKGIDNLQENFFEEIEGGRTKWRCNNEFLPLNFKMGLLVWLMPKTFKKQSMRYLKDFKNFAENGVSVNHEKA